MKRFIAAVLFSALSLHCAEVEQITPMLYPEGRIPNPAEAVALFEPAALEPGPAGPVRANPVSAVELEKALAGSGIPATFLSPDDKKTLAAEGACLLRDGELAAMDSLDEAYLHLAGRGWPVLVTADRVADLYFNMFHYLFVALEKKRVEPALKQLLQDMIHTSLEQYHSMAGDLKEAAWRNTAFLCVASRILDPDAPTPFIVSGMVRKELDLIGAAAGETASPLFSLDSSGNPCARDDSFACVDYAVFRQHPLVQRFPGTADLHRAFLWLSRFSFPLRAKYPFYQTVLLTDCIKRTQFSQGATQVPAWRAWLAMARFYMFAFRTEPGDNFHQVDRLLGNIFPRSFNENDALETSRLGKLESTHPEFLAFRQGNFRFLPAWEDSLASYFQPLLVPEVGANTGHPLYDGFLLQNLSLDCAPDPGYARRREIFTNCSRMVPADIDFLYCNALNLSFKNPDVMTIFRTLPSSSDLLAALGWPDGVANPNDAFCFYGRNLDRLQTGLGARPPAVWGGTFTDLSIYCARELDPDRSTVATDATAPTWRRKARLAAYDVLTQIQISPRDQESTRSVRDSTPGHSFTDVRLEPSAAFYNSLWAATDYLRKLLMLLGFSDLELDEILIQYTDLVEQLRNISRQLTAGETLSPAHLLFVQSLFSRFSFLETRLTGYFKDLGPLPLQRPFPRCPVLWNCPQTRSMVLGISGDFHLFLAICRANGADRVCAAPQPCYYELITSQKSTWKRQEIVRLLEQGLPRAVD